MRYFFNTRGDGVVTTDDVGLELGQFNDVKAVAAKTLAEMACDVLPNSSDRCLAVDIRDANGCPVLTTELTIRAIVPQAVA